MSYKIQQKHQNSFEIITLKNDSISAKIAVNIGNTLFSFQKYEVEKIYFPFSLEEYKNNTKLAGNPFMHPWANRLEAEYIRIENYQHNFPKQHLYLLYRDGNDLPLHGLLLKSDKWKTIELYEGESLCYHIAEFIFDDADLLSVFPFKHTIQIKHQLQNNELKVETKIINNDEKEMPISFGFHPYFIKNKNDAQLTIPAFYAIDVDEKMIPNGELTLKEHKWNFVDDTIALETVAFDDGFRNLKYNTDEQAFFLLDVIKIIFDRNYRFAQIYAPQNENKPYVCIEPMTAVTNSLNTNDCREINKGEKFTAAFSISF